MLGNNAANESFIKKKTVFIEHYQLSDNAEYLRELNNKVLTWHEYCKSITTEYPESKIYLMDGSEKNDL